MVRTSASQRGFRRFVAVSAPALAVYIAYLAVAPGSARTVGAVNNLVQMLVPLAVAAPLAARAASAARGRARLAWWLIAAACCSWGVGQGVWTWFEVVLEREVPYPSLADVGFLGAAPLLLAGVLCYPAKQLRSFGRARAVVDGGIIASSLLFVCFGTFLEGAQAEAGDSLAAWLLAVAYPVCDVIVAAVVVAVLTRRAERWSGPLPLIAAGVVALAVADAAFAVATATDTYLLVSPGDVGWPVGFLLLGLASLHPSDAVEEVEEATVASGIPLLLPYLPMLAAVAVLVGRVALRMPVSPLLVVIGSVTELLVVGRQVVMILENRQLTTDMGRTVTALREREDELQHQAFHDPLTGLANRALLRDRLEHALAGRSAAPLSLLFIDLDDFKTVNDSLGHDAGDRLLELVAERLRACVRPGDTVARLGGDEFAILLAQNDGDAPARLADRVLVALESPFRIAGRDLRVQASLGLVPASLPGATAEDVVQDADLAMYAAKEAGKGRCARFEPQLRRQAVDRLELVSDLREAAHLGQLVLHYQPVVDLSTFEVIGLEALVRWAHPRRGLLSPDEFIPLAEETGAITSLGLWVLEEACRTAVAWTAQDGPAPVVGVNVSARQLADADLADDVAAVLERTGIEPGRLELEVTESVLLTDDALDSRLRQLRRLGVRLAIDDFGTGYSSLSYLTRLPVDVVKIDRSFVDRLTTSPAQHVLVRSVVQLAASLGLRTVGEGIETEQQLAILQELGCVAGQGYLLGMPDPVPALTLTRRRAVPVVVGTA